MFPLVITLMMVSVIIVLVYPLLRPPRASIQTGVEAAEWIDLQIEKEALLRSLADMEIEWAQAHLPEEDYQRRKGETTHRLAALLSRMDVLTDTVETQAAQPPRVKVRWGVVCLLSVGVVGGASGVYQLAHWKLERAQVAAMDATEVGNPKIPAVPGINPEEMVKRLEKRLQENPDNLQGQMMAGRSYMAMERWEDAKRAWEKVVELDARNHTAHYSLGEILIRTQPPGDPSMATEALSHFDLALINLPSDPTILWARGIALIQLGRTAEADAAWTTAYQGIPPNTQASEMIKQALSELRSGKPLF
jgi:cytochrome c-type biogenesis protein CcmH